MNVCVCVCVRADNKLVAQAALSEAVNPALLTARANPANAYTHAATSLVT